MIQASHATNTVKDQLEQWGVAIKYHYTIGATETVCVLARQLGNPGDRSPLSPEGTGMRSVAAGVAGSAGGDRIPGKNGE